MVIGRRPLVPWFVTDIVPAHEVEDSLDDPMPRDYRRFRDEEGIPVHTGLYIEDVNTVSVAEWKRTGQLGAYVNLYGTGGLNDLQVHEIEPGGETTRQHHFFEEIVYVSEGRGATVVGTGDDEVSFEWSAGSLFFLPPSTPYRHINVAGDEPARLVADTSLPQYLTMIKNREVIFDLDYDFWSRHRDSDYFSGGGVYHGDDDATPGEGFIWQANFVPDVRTFDRLDRWGNQAGGYVYFYMPHSNMFAHIGEFASGTYKKAHRHYPGAQIVGLGGEGYSLLWREDRDHKVRVDWSPNSVFVPPALWYHHHFGLSDGPARYLALHPTEIGTLKHTVMDPAGAQNTIDYVDEDPEIRALYEAELAERDIAFRMPEACYTDPEYEW